MLLPGTFPFSAILAHVGTVSASQGRTLQVLQARNRRLQSRLAQFMCGSCAAPPHSAHDAATGSAPSGASAVDQHAELWQLINPKPYMPYGTWIVMNRQACSLLSDPRHVSAPAC